MLLVLPGAKPSYFIDLWYSGACAVLAFGAHLRTDCGKLNRVLPQVVGLWRADLRKVNPKAAESLADPSQYANLFPNMDSALQAEALQVQPSCHVCQGFCIRFASDHRRGTTDFSVTNMRALRCANTVAKHIEH